MLAVAAVGMAAAGTTAYLVQRDRILQEVDEKLLHSLESVRAVAVGAVEAPEDTEAESPPTPEFENPEAVLQAVLSRVLPDANESSLGLVDGKPRFVSVAEVSFHLEDDPDFIDRVVSEVTDGSIRMGTHRSELGHLRYIAIPITVEGSEETGLFVTAIEVNDELGEITTAFQTYAWVAALALIAVGLVGWFVAGRLLRPIRVLRETASRITASDLRERIPVTGNDDVSALTATVNDMLARIEESIRAQGQLLDDVRHELKTPVTIVRGHLELLDEHRPEDVKETRDLVIDELDRMITLIDDIALLASTEVIQLRLEPTDVADLMRLIHGKSTAIAGHEWTLNLGGISAGTSAMLDPARITQAVLQLVDNAAKYSPAETEITLGATRLPDVIRVWVEDTGPGIAPEAQQRIFERFGRADTGRGIEGSGLGLPIVNAIARAHGGQVILNSSSTGSRFTIEVPTHAPEGPA